MKKCRKCEIDQDINEFHFDRSKPDGHRTICKTCRTKHDKRSRRDANVIQLRKNQAAKKQDPKNIARARALKRLVENHMGEFSRLVNSEVAQMGLVEKKWVGVEKWANEYN